MSYYQRVKVNNIYNVGGPLATVMFREYLNQMEIDVDSFEIVDPHTIDVWFKTGQDYFTYLMFAPDYRDK